MSWNFRIIETEGKHDDNPWTSVGIHEVYYEDGVPRSCTKDPVKVVGEDIDDLKETFEMMRAAFDKPILKMKDFENHAK